MIQPATPTYPRPRLGRYELLERLGRGGMAEVYKARLPGAHGVAKLVALKRILPDTARDPKFVQMFVREARLSTRLTHPNLIQVFEFGQEQGELYLTMELVDGCDLRRVLTAQAALGKKVPQEIALCIALGVLRGLEHAHKLTDELGAPLNVVHRDLSPANVLLSYAGAIKVADFGVAHVDGPEKSDANLLKGKLAYMAPEQLQGQPVDARADVFAAACVLYELLAGEPVYGGKVTPSLVRKVARGQVPQVRRAMPHLDPALAEVLQRALMPDRSLRTPSCDRFAAELVELVHAGRLRCAEAGELALYLQVLVPRAAPAAPEPFPMQTLRSERPPPQPQPQPSGLANLFDSAELDLPLDEPAPLDADALVSVVPARLPDGDEPLVPEAPLDEPLLMEEPNSEVVELAAEDVVEPAMVVLPAPLAAMAPPRMEQVEASSFSALFAMPLGAPKAPRDAPVMRFTPAPLPDALPAVALSAWPVLERVAPPQLPRSRFAVRALLGVLLAGSLALLAARWHQARVAGAVEVLPQPVVAAAIVEPPRPVQSPATEEVAPAPGPAKALRLQLPELKLELPALAPAVASKKAALRKPQKKKPAAAAKRGAGLDVEL